MPAKGLIGDITMSTKRLYWYKNGFKMLSIKDITAPAKVYAVNLTLISVAAFWDGSI